MVAIACDKPETVDRLYAKAIELGAKDEGAAGLVMRRLYLTMDVNFSERWFVDAAATYVAASGVRMELPADSSQKIESDYDHLALSLGVGWRF